MDAFGVRGWGVGLCVFFFRVSCSCHCPMQALRVQNYSWWGFKLYLIRIPKYAKKNNLQRRPGILCTPCTTHKTFCLKIYAALEVNSWYLFVQINYTWRLLAWMPTWFHVHQLIYIYELNRAAEEDTQAWTTSFMCII